ncbi:MAG TPA: hypothetical protein VFM54_07320 [Micromonosporaceae bacterium]|nr:hypothetical protein [Micromonosporaceae bacterium]
MNPMNERAPHGDGGSGHPEPVRLRLVGPAGDATTGGPGQRFRPYRLPLLLLLCGPAVLALVVLDAPAWARVAPVLAYLMVVPGLACVRLLGLADGGLSVVLGAGLSLALGILVAQAMIYLDLWSPTLGLSTLVAVASASGLVELYRGPPAGPPRDEEPEDAP